MPKINLRSIPMRHDEDEDELRSTARERGYQLWIDRDARRHGRPHVLLLEKGSREPVAGFGKCAAGLRWLEARAGIAGLRDDGDALGN